MINLSQEAAQDEVKGASFYEAEALPGVRGIRAIYRGSNLWQKGVDYLKKHKFNPYSKKRKLIMINMICKLKNFVSP